VSAKAGVDNEAVVPVAWGDGRRYDVLLGSGVLTRPESWPDVCRGHRALVVTNPTVAALHAASLEQSLKQRYTHVHRIEWHDGEQHKTWDAVNAIATRLLELGADRHVTLYALGGGVIGDITGFAAACYMRGVPFVQVPTTLLSQVDSSVGGKTAINHPLGKNMLGAFHQPVAVLCDLQTLRSLPVRELRAGVAEIIKIAAVADPQLFARLEGQLAAVLEGDEAALLAVVRDSVALKAKIVAQDEREQGLRAVLNFGHTFGHAIEAGMGYGRWLHGEAVGCGMVLASRLSHQLGLLSQADVDRLVALIARAGLPQVPPAMAWSDWQRWMRVDKKAHDGAIRYILLDGALGAATLRKVDDALVEPIVMSAAAAPSTPTF
jgi:3-dehydroquinate synthase